MSLRRLSAIALVAFVGFAATAQASPTIIVAPTVDGTATVAGLLTATGIELEGAVADDTTLTWERSTGSHFVELVDAHDATYRPVPADAGHRLRVHVVVETADGSDEAWSAPSAVIGYPAGGRLRIGGEPGSPLAFDRWIVVAGDPLRVRGRLAPELASADARIVLEPTVPTYAADAVPVAIDADGRVQGEVRPTVNAVAWLVLTPVDEPEQRIRLGVVGVRPRIDLVLGARPDGRDGAGRRLVRDLRVLAGSTFAPAQAGVRLTWEGMLPGDHEGTAVCRTTERVVSGAGGVLRGGCRTRGAWSSARWRLVLDPGTADPGGAPFLPATSAWVVPRLADAAPAPVPNLPRSSARLRPWS